jgi:hypothetical protein
VVVVVMVVCGVCVVVAVVAVKEVSTGHHLTSSRSGNFPGSNSLHNPTAISRLTDFCPSSFAQSYLTSRKVVKFRASNELATRKVVESRVQVEFCQPKGGRR